MTPDFPMQTDSQKRKRWPRWLSRLVRLFGLIPREDVLATFEEPANLRSNILRYGPDGYDIYTREQIDGLLADERRWREQAEAERDRLSNLCQAMRRSWAKRLGRGKGTCEFTRQWLP